MIGIAAWCLDCSKRWKRGAVWPEFHAARTSHRVMSPHGRIWPKYKVQELEASEQSRANLAKGQEASSGNSQALVAWNAAHPAHRQALGKQLAAYNASTGYAAQHGPRGPRGR